jgi:hypothetical protein
MLTGTQAFHDETVSDTLASVLSKDPEWERLPAATPPGVRRLLERCLQKDAKKRKADLICAYVCRLLNFMDRKGVRQVTPTNSDETASAPFVEGFTPEYIQRALASWPKQGAKAPWRVYQNYIRDTISLKWSSIDKTELEFSNPPKTSPTPVSGELAQTVK